MKKGNFLIQKPKNEPVFSYNLDSEERKELMAVYKKMFNETVEIPMYIGREEIYTSNKVSMTCPHDHQHILGYFSEGDSSHVNMAIESALAVKDRWESMSWESRASIFLKAADLLAGPYRARIVAATMLAQSKNIHQAEIDAACELIDFLRFNAYYMQNIYNQQPDSESGLWNRMDYRPLEGFVFAITPFNFTAVAGNLPAAPAMMGNTVIWKPNYTQVYSANIIMEVFKKAGLPDGVINLIYADGPVAGDIIFSHPQFSGLHFTGSTNVFKKLWHTIGNNIYNYNSYPRIVGETGGKDYIIAHSSADAQEVAIGMIRGAFEYQGQKCSAASRAYIPSNIWQEVKGLIIQNLNDIKIGSPENSENFINAVIDKKSFDKIKDYILRVKEDQSIEVICGGNCDDSKGWFIEPTVIETKDPNYFTMCEEIFGPLLTVFVYEPENFEETLTIIDETSPYALTGAIFSQDRFAIEKATWKLRNSAGNFYINDKPTGSIIGQQPFGGARASGTNDKAGSMMNLQRWVSARAIKETFVPPRDYKYPSMDI